MRFSAGLVAIGLVVAPAAFAQFSPGPNPINTPVTGQQSLTGGTGTVDSGGEIRIASGSTAALLMSGTSTLVNNGSIYTLGSGRAIDSNSGIANLSIFNNGLISAVSTDAFRVNTNSAVSLINTGTIRVTAGGQAIDWAAITSAKNSLQNNIGGSIIAIGEDAVRPGAFGQVVNAGFITASPVVSGTTVSGSDGIDLRTLSNIEVTNTGYIEGRHGIATDGSNAGPFAFTLFNGTGGLINALNGSGVNIDGVSATVKAKITNQLGAIIRGGVMGGAVAEGDGDGIDVDGVIDLINYGAINGYGARGGSNNAEGVAAGGGSIFNGENGFIIGSTLLADAPNGDSTRAGNGILIDDSNGGNAVAKTGINNYGTIHGRNGFGIKIVGTFDDRIVNHTTGLIRGAGTGATIQTGAGNDTVINEGQIVSDIGNAIDLEAGDDILALNARASVTGNISGGLGNDTLIVNELSAPAYGQVRYAGVLSNFETVDVQGGSLELSGANTYSGQTIVEDIATLRLVGSNRLSSDSNLTLRGTLELDGVSGIANTQTFASLFVDGNADIDLGGSSLTFNALGGLGSSYQLSVIDWSEASSPDYAFRFSGDLSASAQFLALMDHTSINGLKAGVTFDGLFTNVSAVPLPAGVWLLLSGMAGVGALRRRQRA